MKFWLLLHKKPRAVVLERCNRISIYFVMKSCKNLFHHLILVKPTAVSILDKISHVSADKEVEVTCQAVGGYPSPKLTWLLGSKLLRAFDEVSWKYDGLLVKILSFFS